MALYEPSTGNWKQAVAVPDDLYKRIKRYQEKNNLPSYSEAVRQLLRKGVREV